MMANYTNTYLNTSFKFLHQDTCKFFHHPTRNNYQRIFYYIDNKVVNKNTEKIFFTKNENV
jgi:hypothetical protein